MQVEQILSNELQLGPQLNKSVVDDRANFALLLALMSQDVEDQAQFHFGANKIQLTDSSQLSLRSTLEVPRQQALIANGMGEQQSLNLGRIASERQHDARLLHCIAPEPLSFELGKTRGIASEVFENLDYMTAKKFSGQYKAESIPTLVPDDIIAQQQNYAAQLI